MKVAVLMGGASVLREKSLASGKRLCTALTERGHEVVPLDTTANLAHILREERPDIVFSALLGVEGESGAVQELLQFLDIPCVGASSQTARDAWDRGVLDGVLDGYRGALGGTMTATWASGIRLSRTAVEGMGADAVLDLAAGRIPGGYPLCVKPAHRSLGVASYRVASADELQQAVAAVLAVDRAVVIQQWVEGVAMRVFLLGEGLEAFVLPSVEREAAADEANEREAAAKPVAVSAPAAWHAPVRLASLSADEADAQAIRSEIERAALEAYLAFGMRDLGQVDLVWDGAQTRVLQVATGIDFSEGAPFDQACQAASLTFGAVANALVGGLDL
jgi:D-alanine-D-alanine ligase